MAFYYPYAPTNLTAESGDQTIYLSWTASQSGTNPILYYVIFDENGYNIGGTAPGLTSYTVRTTAQETLLVNGTSYTYTVAAMDTENNIGASSLSVTATPSTIPSFPTGLTYVINGAYVDFSWNSPNNGGSIITSYVINDLTGIKSVITGYPPNQPNTYGRIGSLVYQGQYTFSVFATNINGAGSMSNSVTVIGPDTPAVVGATGPIGATGASGRDGNDGATGASGNDGNDGATGASGRDGNNGNDGATGASGRDGNHGNDGATGASGRDGRDGNDGTTGASGRDGRDGNDGATGRDGRDGNDGATGASGRDGNDGNDGNDGATGATGPRGREGLIGPTGPMGPMYIPPPPPPPEYIVCFMKGTFILTTKGYVPIENLKAGTVLLTNGKIIQNEKLDSLQINQLIDTKTKLNYPKQQIQWISSFTVHNPDKNSYPICFKCGSIYKDNEKVMPSQDLYVSPEHSICVNNQMIPAKLLINGKTIFQDTSFKNKSIEYYHIEMPYHCAIISNGLLTESYLDSGNRGIFKNSPRLQNKRPTIKQIQL